MDQTNLANQPGIASPQAGEPIESEQGTRPSLGSVQRRLPWLIAGGALLVYFLTLPRWVTILGLGPLARVSGWDWRPAFVTPLQYLVTYPCRWLPGGVQLLALNLLAAIFAILTLALLARSVALLPHNRTRDQRQLERGDHSLLSIPLAWLPPVLAVCICGLQLTFWEHAVVWTGEALDLLLFAYVIRCLLEYRVDQRDSWLVRLAFVYGLGITNNIAMISFFPALVIALVWIKGLSLFKFRVLAPMALWGLAGLSLYLLLPIIHTLSGSLDATFWQVLRLNLGHQKNAILDFRRVIILMLSFTSLLPVLFMGIKWPDGFGDISAAGNALTNLMTHVIHGVFLLACLYVAFDPAYSPRKLGAPYTFLPFYYLGALSIGYCAGYFLLVFGSGRLKAWQRPSLARTVLNRGIVVLVCIAAVGAPVGLAYQNLPRLKASLGRGLSQYAALTAKSLPSTGAVVLSDSPLGQYPLQMYALYAALKQQGAAEKYLFVETAPLANPFYQRYLSHKYPKAWPELPAGAKSTEAVDSLTQIRLLDQAGQSKPIYYLQPSFGYYFERWYLRPHNLVYELKTYPANSLTYPPLSREEMEENVQFWLKLKKEELMPLLQSRQPSKDKRAQPMEPLMGVLYSRALDHLGVELQQNGDLERAAEFFAFALELDPESASAFVNMEYNKNLRAGHTEPLKRTDEVEKRLSRFGGIWDALWGWNGPVDEPSVRNEMGLLLAKGRSYRQAAQHLLRVISLTPTNIDARVGLPDMCLKAGMFDLALKYVMEVKTFEPKLHTAEKEALLQTEAWATFYRNDFPAAERLLNEAQKANPLNDVGYSTLAEIYLRMGRITNAMETLERELKAQPENGSALNNYARLKILNNELEPAVKLLDKALGLDPKNVLILFNRALCNLKLNKFAEAQRDYETLETTLPKVSYRIHYGLFDIAFKKKNPKTAVKYGELYLKNAPRGTPEYKDVQERVKKARTGAI